MNNDGSLDNMLQWRNVICLWFAFRTRRSLPAFVRNRIPTILILFCFCSLLTSLVLRKNRDELDDGISVGCNASSSGPWKAIRVPGQIRTARVEKANASSRGNSPKTILLWTKYFSEEYSDDFYFFKSGRQTFRRYNCKYSNCAVTSNRSLIRSADAVLFHGRDLRFSDIPKRGNRSQIWILYSMEPPRYMVLKWNLVRTLFNWTMTYRSDSDVQVKYGEIVPRFDTCDRELSGHRNVFQRNKGAVWLVSNCRTEARREAYVRELRKRFDVDIYGKCSLKKRCEPAQSEACYKLLSNYKYYLSFENSICKDYVTEKFFNVLQYDIVPVVLGGANYSSTAPPNSFIDATVFPNPGKLAEYLMEIAKNSSWYESFFEWKRHYSIHLHTWMCDLCERLNEPKLEVRILPKDLWSWWIPQSLCRRWTRKKGFKRIFLRRDTLYAKYP